MDAEEQTPEAGARPGGREGQGGPKPVVGLIGGMGSGKSFVAEQFRLRGAKVISGDQLGHEALAQSDVLAQVVQRWGRELLDPQRKVQRRRLAAIVFKEPAERRALEAMVFPWIERRIREEIRDAQADPNVALIVLDAAILLEAGWHRSCAWLVYVHAPRAARLKRLQEQRGWDAQEVLQREQAQLPLAEKVSRADFVLDNTDGPERVIGQVEELLGQWGVGKWARSDSE